MSQRQPEYSQEDTSSGEYKRGVLDEGIINEDMKNSTIMVQGQRAVVNDQNGKATRKPNAPSNLRGRELLEVLREGHTVKQTIHNIKVTDTTIFAQGQEAQLYADLKQYVPNGHPVQTEKYKEVVLQEQPHDFDDGDL